MENLFAATEIGGGRMSFYGAMLLTVAGFGFCIDSSLMLLVAFVLWSCVLLSTVCC